MNELRPAGLGLERCGLRLGSRLDGDGCANTHKDIYVTVVRQGRPPKNCQVRKHVLLLNLTREGKHKPEGMYRSKGPKLLRCIKWVEPTAGISPR